MSWAQACREVIKITNLPEDKVDIIQSYVGDLMLVVFYLGNGNYSSVFVADRSEFTELHDWYVMMCVVGKNIEMFDQILVEYNEHCDNLYVYHHYDSVMQVDSFLSAPYTNDSNGNKWCGVVANPLRLFRERVSATIEYQGYTVSPHGIKPREFKLCSEILYKVNQLYYIFSDSCPKHLEVLNRLYRRGVFKSESPKLFTAHIRRIKMIGLAIMFSDFKLRNGRNILPSTKDAGGASLQNKSIISSAFSAFSNVFSTFSATRCDRDENMATEDEKEMNTLVSEIRELYLSNTIMFQVVFLDREYAEMFETKDYFKILKELDPDIKECQTIKAKGFSPCPFNGLTYGNKCVSCLRSQHSRSPSGASGVPAKNFRSYQHPTTKINKRTSPY